MQFSLLIFFCFFFLHYTRFISDDLATCLTDDGPEPPATLNNVNPILNFLYTQTSFVRIFERSYSRGRFITKQRMCGWMYYYGKLDKLGKTQFISNRLNRFHDNSASKFGL